MKAPFSAFESILERAREIGEDVAAPAAAQVDRDARWPEETLRAMQESALGGLVVPAEAGGLGQGFRAVTQVCEEIARHCSSAAICFGMHCVGTAGIAARATDYQRDTWLEQIAAGEHLTTLALSEPGTGSHFWLPQTELERRQETFVLRGQKSFVTNGGHADSYVMSTAGTNSSQPGEFSVVIVPSDAEGLEWQQPWLGMGMRGNSARNVELRDVVVPRANLLGAEGDEIWYVFHVLAPYFLVAMSGTYLGIASAALEEARDHLAARKYSHGGRSPAQSPVVQRELGILWRRVEATRRLIYHAANSADAGSDDSLLALCSAKAEVARCVVDVVNGALTLVGGKGYGEHSKLERLMRDARAADVMAPTTMLLETWIGRAYLGLPLLSE